MKAMLVLSVLLSASAAVAQPMPPPPPPPATFVSNPDTVPNGFVLNLDVFGFSGSFTLAGLAAGTAGVGTTAATSTNAGSVAAGYYFDQNEFLLDIGFAGIGVPSGPGSASAVFLFDMAPTFRRYMSPLRVGGVTPFGEGDLSVGLYTPSVGSDAWALGLGVGAGAEWLFTRNMGLEGTATFGYTHINSGTNGGIINLDAFGLGAKIGLTIHM